MKKPNRITQDDMARLIEEITMAKVNNIDYFTLKKRIQEIIPKGVYHLDKFCDKLGFAIPEKSANRNAQPSPTSQILASSILEIAKELGITLSMSQELHRISKRQSPGLPRE